MQQKKKTHIAGLQNMTESSPEEHWIEDECEWEMCRQSAESIDL